jgi:hypothetical protein
MIRHKNGEILAAEGWQGHDFEEIVIVKIVI